MKGQTRQKFQVKDEVVIDTHGRRPKYDGLSGLVGKIYMSRAGGEGGDMWAYNVVIDQPPYVVKFFNRDLLPVGTPLTIVSPEEESRISLSKTRASSRAKILKSVRDPELERVTRLLDEPQAASLSPITRSKLVAEYMRRNDSYKDRRSTFSKLLWAAKTPEEMDKIVELARETKEKQ